MSTENQEAVEPCCFCRPGVMEAAHFREVGTWWAECPECGARGPSRETKEEAMDAVRQVSRLVKAAREYAEASASVYIEDLERCNELVPALLDVAEPFAPKPQADDAARQQGGQGG